MLKSNASAFILLFLLAEATFTTDVPTFTLPIILSMLAGFSISIGGDWNDNTITFKKSAIKLIYAIALSYMGLFAWRDFEITWNIVYYTATVSCFSMFIVNELKSAFQMGFKAYIRNFINNILAKNDGV